MSKTVDNTTSQNATKELTPEEARKKRKHLLELARGQAEKAEKSADGDEHCDSTATFILPGD